MFIGYFYPRSPCGERRYRPTPKPVISWHFYPRSPCGERRIGLVFLWWGVRFLSTLSLRRATWPGLLARPFFIISIHALLAESDRALRQLQFALCYFYPRSPCGERQKIVPCFIIYIKISIHALLAESDNQASAAAFHAKNFYPRSPCGERRVTVLGIQHRVGISIHALLAESDFQTTALNR